MTADDWGDAGGITGEVQRIPRGLSADAEKRFRRLARLSWILDRAIPVGHWRVGLDPILGLLPGAGDWMGAMLSLYVLYEGARLGAPAGIIARMAGNILVETLVGAVPLAGDAFDFVWQANTRNVALIQRHHGPDWRPRSLRGVWLTVLVIVALVFAALFAVAYGLFKLLVPLTGL